MTSLAEALDERCRAGLLRRRRCLDSAQGTEVVIAGRRYLSFSSNDYLGLAADPRLSTAFAEGARRFGVGSGASHLVTGHSRPHAEFEEAFADFIGHPRALLFGSGYLANLSVVSVLARFADRTFHDRLNHASLLDGSRLAGQRYRRYPHSDMTCLNRWLVRCTERGERALVVSDGVFSMDGDIAPVAELVTLSSRHEATLVIDDAHGCGVIGPEGRGSIALAGIASGQRPIVVATLGKALGAYGAVVAAGEDVIEALIQFARPYIYTTALPPAMACVARCALEIARSEDWRREHLARLIDRFYHAATERGLELPPRPTAAVPIIPLIVGSAERAVALSEALYRLGILVTAIRPPTVPAGSSRLRITLSAAHREADVDRLVDAIVEAL